MPKLPKQRGESRRRIPRKKGKKSVIARSLIDRSKLYGLSEAIAILEKPEVNFVKFEQTVEVSMKLGVDPRK